MRRAWQMSLPRAYVGAPGAGSAPATDASKAVDEDVTMLGYDLQTVCRKLDAKIRELDCVAGDLSNLMKVCAIPAIFVDEKLNVRSFTRESRRIYRLSQQNVGQSLLDVACGLNYDSLGDDFRRVAETSRPVNRYVERRGCDIRYFLRMMPNFCRDQSFSGAALIFTEIENQDWRTA